MRFGEGLALRTGLQFMAATALAGGMLEHLLSQVLWPNPYFDSDLFFFPSVALTALALFIIYGALAAAIVAYRRWRGKFNARAVIGALAAPSLLGLLLYNFHGPLHPYLARLYTPALLGSVLSMLLLFALAWTALLLALGARSTRKAADPEAAERLPLPRRRWFALAAALLITAGFWRPFHDNFIGLYLLMFIFVSSPLLTGGGLYFLFRRLGGEGLYRISALYFWSVVLLAAGFLGLREYRDWGAPFLSAGIAIAAGWSLIQIVRLLRGARSSRLRPSAATLTLIALPLLGVAIGAPRPEPKPGEQILLLTVDTLRRDAISAYNPNAKPTPNIDALIEEDLNFTRAWSGASWTLPAVASMMTGMPSRTHQAVDFDKTLPPTFETLAERLQEQGYVCEGVVYNGLLRPGRGVEQGFDRYAALPLHSPPTTLGQRLARTLNPERYALGGGSAGQAHLTLQRLKRYRDRPYFFWLHLYDPHAPYSPPADFWPEGVPREKTFPKNQGLVIPDARTRKELFELYQAEVQYLDHVIGDLIDALKREGLYDNLMIVFTSDHGEEFWEHARWGHIGPPVESTVRMPLSIRLPGGDRPRLIEEIVSTQETLPIMLAMVDHYNLPPAERIAPEDVVRNVVAEVDGSIESHFMHSGRQRVRTVEEAIIFGERPFKYRKNHANGHETLFDLRNDPGERRSLAPERPDLLNQAREIFQRHVEEAEMMRSHHAESETMDLPPEVLNELKGLGYID